VMNLHLGDGLLSDCFTFVGYLPKILPRALEIFRQLGDVLHDGHMEIVTCLENTLHWRSSVLHLGGGSGS
jgi:hypothetical protein